MEERGGGIIRLLSSPSPIVLDERETVAPLPPPPPPRREKGEIGTRAAENLGIWGEDKAAGRPER